MPSPLAEAFLMGILNGCYETPSKNMIDAHAAYIQDVEQRGEQVDPSLADDAAKMLKKAIGRYNSRLVLLQGVIELDAKFSDADFIDFWQRYIFIYNSMFENKQALGIISTSFDGDLGLLVGEEIEVEEPGEPGGDEQGGQPPLPTGKPIQKPGLAGIFETLAKMNSDEQEREQEIQFWHNQTDALYTFLKSDAKFMAMLRSENFTREQIEKEYNKLLRRYLRQTEDTKVKKLIDENKEMFLEEFKEHNIKSQNSIPYVTNMQTHNISDN